LATLRTGGEAYGGSTKVEESKVKNDKNAKTKDTPPDP